MDKDLVSGDLGSIGKYDVAFRAGRLIVSGSASLPPGENISASVEVDSDKVLDAIAAAVPGKIDDVVIGVIKAALKA